MYCKITLKFNDHLNIQIEQRVVIVRSKRTVYRGSSASDGWKGLSYQLVSLS